MALMMILLRSSPWMHQMGETLMNRSISTAVLLVGWGRGSGGLPYPDPFYYYQVLATLQICGNDRHGETIVPC
jgi:hypothetical protein